MLKDTAKKVHLTHDIKGSKDQKVKNSIRNSWRNLEIHFLGSVSSDKDDNNTRRMYSRQCPVSQKRSRHSQSVQ